MAHFEDVNAVKSMDSNELLELISSFRANVGDDQLGQSNDSYVKADDCHVSVKQLMRVLNNEQRAGGFEAMSQLVIWEIPKTDLIPILTTYRRDTKLARRIVSILAVLTIPVTRSFDRVDEHLEKLQLCKELFVKGDVVAVLMGMLAEPLSRGCDDRTKEDKTIIDSMLHLLRNLLAIRTDGDSVDNTRSLLDDALLRTFFQHNVMDFFVVIAQNLDHEANEKWTMLMSNILFLLTDGFVPEDLSFTYHKSIKSSTDLAAVRKAVVDEKVSNLKNLRQKEKNLSKQDKFRLSGRHSQFGGSLVKTEADGSKRIVDARQLLVPAKLAPKPKQKPKASRPWDRTNREASNETKALLFQFLEKLVDDDVFSLVMHQTVDYISNASSDLEMSNLPSFQRDMDHFIRLIAWFIRFDYVKQVQKIRLLENPNDIPREHPIMEKCPKDEKNQKFTLEHIETVLNPQIATFLFKRADHILEQKPIPFMDIHVVFRALSEMLNTCNYILFNGTTELRYEAKKTLYSVFLDRKQFLDRVPWLIQHVGVKMPKEYVQSLIRIVDLTFHALEQIALVDKSLLVLRKSRRGKVHSVNSDRGYEGDEKEASDEEQKAADQNAGPELEKFNDFVELQTQEFGLTDYIRKFQHNKVIEICLLVLDDFESNTDELNMALKRLLVNIQKGFGDSLVALPAIFCQARILLVFDRLFSYCQSTKVVRSSIRELEEFAKGVVDDLRRLTAKGRNSHIFADILFWRSTSENRDFEDMNLRMAYEQARMEGRSINGEEAGSSASSDDDDEEFVARKKKLRSAKEEELDDEKDVLLDPEAIAAAKQAAEERRLMQKRMRRTRPKDARTAFQFFCEEIEDQVVDENPELFGVSLVNTLTLRWNEVPVPERFRFDQMEADDKRRFDAEMVAWNAMQEEKKKKKEDAKQSKKRLTRREEPTEQKGGNEEEESGSSEDLPLGLIAKGQRPKKLKRPKHAQESTGEAAAAAAAAIENVNDEEEKELKEDGGFSAAEDALLKESYMQLKERTPSEIRLFLPLHSQSDRPIHDLILRLGKLGVLSNQTMNNLLESD